MGECICQKPWCSECGNFEDAQRQLAMVLYDLRCRPHEYGIVAAVGIEAVKQARAAESRAVRVERANVAADQAVAEALK